jgi:hypothetical protein
MNASAIGVLHVEHCHWSSAAVHRGNHVSPNPGSASVHCYLMEQSGAPYCWVNSKRENEMSARNQPPKTQIAEDGLRYTSNAAGSAFAKSALSAVTGTTMS